MIGPGRIVITGFRDAKSFLDKLLREIERLHEAQLNNGSTEEIFDHGLNATITAWHIHEAIAIEHGFNKDKYRDDMKEQYPDLGLLHDIATHAKHFKVTTAQRTTPDKPLEVRTSARAMFTDEEWSYVAEGLGNNVEQPVYVRMKNSFQTVLKAEDRDVEELLQGVYNFWKKQLATLTSD